MHGAIETEAQFRQALNRAAALREHLAAIRAVQALASANRHIGYVEAEDTRDLAALDDALADIGYTLRSIEASLADWEACTSYGAPDDSAADRSWHLRRVL
jgi:hypothetical protein